MTAEKLTTIAYQYFPKGIDNRAEHDRYVTSAEFKNLSNHCITIFNKEQNGDFDDFYDRIRLLDTSKNFHNAALFHWNDRCYNVQLAELIGDKHYSVCLNVSVIVPFYLVYVLETTLTDTTNEPGSFGIPRFTKPVINTEKSSDYKVLMQQMASVAESYFNVKPFPEELLNDVISDLTLEDIKLGAFTFFNAFFLDKYEIRI